LLSQKLKQEKNDGEKNILLLGIVSQILELSSSSPSSFIHNSTKRKK
jgi:hypothetical protein